MRRYGPLKPIALSLSVLLLLAAGALLCLRAGRVWENNRSFGFSMHAVRPEGLAVDSMSRSAKLIWAFKEAAGFSAFHSDYGQDKWISEFVFPGTRNGYFVDVGSGDGVLSSNTKALEDRGWRGVCIDPFPTHMEHRRCTVFREVVHSAAGEKVRFDGSGQTGRIAGPAGSLDQDGSVVLTTTTLDEILARAKAPRFIHYMSIDVEGAELEVLKGLSFDRYSVGALTIEHNYQEPKRSQIAEFLRSKGYQFVQSLYRDDCYIQEDPRAIR